MRALAVVTLTLYSCAFPLGLLVYLSVFRHDLWRQKIMLSLGMLYKRYRARLYYFECINLVRKFAFVVGLVLFKRNSAGPMAWALGVSVCAAVYTSLLRPYEDFSVTQLEILAQSVSALILTLGLVFYAVADRMGLGARSFLSAVILLLIGLMIGVIIVGIMRSLRVQHDLVRRGVKGTFGADKLVTHPTFFELDVRIVSMASHSDAQSTTWLIELSSSQPAQLGVYLTQTEIGSGVGADEIAASLATSRAELVRRLRRAGAKDLASQAVFRHDDIPERQPLYARAACSPTYRLHQFCFVLPCRGVYSALIRMADSHKPVVDFQIAADAGSAIGQRLATLTPSMTAAHGALLTPCQWRLGLGQTYQFDLRPPVGISEVVLCEDVPPGESGGYPGGGSPLFMGEDGRRQASIAPASPGCAQLWGRRVERRDAQAASDALAALSTESMPKVLPSSRDEWLLLAEFDVVALTMSGGKRGALTVFGNDDDEFCNIDSVSQLDGTEMSALDGACTPRSY